MCCASGYEMLLHLGVWSQKVRLLRDPACSRCPGADQDGRPVYPESLTQFCAGDLIKRKTGILLLSGHVAVPCVCVWNLDEREKESFY